MSRKRSYLTSIFIDLDGPILDISRRHYIVYKNIIKKLGGCPMARKPYWALKRDRADLGRILKLSGLKTRKLNFKRLWLDLIEDNSFLKYDRVFPSAKSALKLLKKEYKLILVTLRKSSLNLRRQLNKLKLRGLFDLILCQSGNNGDWRIKYRLIKNSNELKMNSVVIGDTEIDILAGKRLGIKTIALLSGIRNREALAKYNPDYTAGSLKGAIRLIKGRK